jgi:hypothetical protein
MNKGYLFSLRSRMPDSWKSKNPWPADPLKLLGTEAYKSLAAATDEIHRQRHAAGLLWIRCNPFPIVPDSGNLCCCIKGKYKNTPKLPAALLKYAGRFGASVQFKTKSK